MENILVKNTLEFISSLSSNNKIQVSKNIYNISNIDIENNNSLYFEDVFDGRELIIENIHNIEINGEDNTLTEILVEPRYANVLTFRNCSNISIRNITLGHTKNMGYCNGGVLKFENCNDINIDKCILFGCGTEGINCSNSNRIKVNNSIIKECTYHIMSVSNSSDIDFYECHFFNNNCFDFINLDNASNISFTGCSIYSNFSNYHDECIFNISSSKNILVKNSTIFDNYVSYLTNDEENLVILDTDFLKNQYANNTIDKHNDGVIYNEIAVTNRDNLTYCFDAVNNIRVYYSNSKKILIEDEDNKSIINDALPSEPSLSPDKTKIIYISPYEWEVLGDLHVFDFVKNIDEVILKAEDIESQNRVKKSIWIDNNTIMLIIGYAYGTIIQGGDVFIYNIIDKTLNPIIKCDESKREQIINIILSDGLLKYTVIYYDEEYINFEEYIKEIRLNDLIK